MLREERCLRPPFSCWLQADLEENTKACWVSSFPGESSRHKCVFFLSARYTGCSRPQGVALCSLLPSLLSSVSPVGTDIVVRSFEVWSSECFGDGKYSMPVG